MIIDKISTKNFLKNKEKITKNRTTSSLEFLSVQAPLVSATKYVEICTLTSGFHL